MRTSSFFLLFFLPLLSISTAAAGGISTEFIYPNFTTSKYGSIDSGGIFLQSPSSNFVAAIYNPGNQQSRFYLCIIHSPSSTIVWSANRDSPVSNNGLVALSGAGLAVTRPDGSVVWSTPRLPSAVRALRLLDSGNLLLLDGANATLWQSFDVPTDALLSGQRLAAGASLVSSINGTDLSHGDYALNVTASGAVMSWKGSQQYWSLSTDLRAFKDRKADVAYMTANATGLYFLSANSKVVYEVFLQQSGLRIMKLQSDGRFHIRDYLSPNSSTSLDNEFIAPSSQCDLPSPCGSLRLCTPVTNTSSCTCPPGYAHSAAGGCSPADGSLLPYSVTQCNENSDTAISYLSLGSGIDYFEIKFSSPSTYGFNISSCRSLCTGNCSCTGFFYRNTSKSCYLLKEQLGSLFSTARETETTVGYIKVIISDASSSSPNASSSKHLVAILLPSMAAFFVLLFVGLLGIMWWRRRDRRIMSSSRRSRTSATTGIKLGRQKSLVTVAGTTPEFEDDDDFDANDISIPGLPTKFSYAELEVATEEFKTRIGSGGFGTVYKGELPDKTLVAVKRIENIGVHGKREFCTEIAIIGNIHHVNLVRLRGFCAQGSKRLLVYEYMNRGSLDRSLFGVVRPTLEWQERVHIAVGAARGLAYLHSGCNHKIIHCDIKPENILLHDGGHVKIADFGLAKLLSPEQSGLFTTMRGTRGYLAPEWLTNSPITDRTDVYSFGMVLLELLRGRKNRSTPSDEEATNTSLGWSNSMGGSAGGYFPLAALERHEEHRYLELADPRLEGRVTEEEVARMVKVALCCLHEEPGLRPSMAAVAAMLEGNATVSEPRLESLNFLRLYGGRGFVEPTVAGAEAGLSAGGVDAMSATTSNSASPSHISSQHVSGPR